jgi:hypothetical protein
MIKDRIRKIIEIKRVPKEKTYKELGVTSANFRGLAKATPVNSDVIERFFKMFPDVNLEWLITGNGPKLKTDVLPNTVTLDRYTEVVRENEQLRLQVKALTAKKKQPRQ